MTLTVEPHTETAPAQYLQSLLAQYRQAAETARTRSEIHYKLGPATIRVHCVGNVLPARFLRALQHHTILHTAEPDLTVLVWDDASSGTRMPPPPWDWATVRLPRGEIRGFNTDRYFTVYDEGAYSLQMFDRETQTAVYWTRDARDLPGYEQSAPLRTILHWHMLSRQMHLVHGGAVGTTKGGVLLAGKGGSGKSTSVLACLASELRYAADDYCVVAGPSDPFVYSMYCSAKLNRDSLERLPFLRPLVVNPESLAQEKAILFLDESLSEKLISGFPLRAIVLPQVSHTTNTKFAPTTFEDAVRALGLSTLMQLARADTASANFIRDLARSVPCYTLYVGTDLKQIPERLVELMA